jgi:hypothetical protein
MQIVKDSQLDTRAFYDLSIYSHEKDETNRQSLDFIGYQR